MKRFFNVRMVCRVPRYSALPLAYAEMNLEKLLLK